METHKLVVKFFAEDPAAVRAVELIPVFHRWIQESRVEGILIDVADYSHLPEGPGVVLVGHEADWYLDAMEGPLGLLYSRKAPLEGTVAERIAAVFRAAWRACGLLEAEPELRGRLRFRPDRALFLVNDRLAAPPAPETFAAWEGPLREALEGIYGAGAAVSAREEGDPRRRFAVAVRLAAGAPAAGGARP